MQTYTYTHMYAHITHTHTHTDTHGSDVAMNVHINTARIIYYHYYRWYSEQKLERRKEYNVI